MKTKLTFLHRMRTSPVRSWFVSLAMLLCGAGAAAQRADTVQSDCVAKTVDCHVVFSTCYSRRHKRYDTYFGLIVDSLAQNDRRLAALYQWFEKGDTTKEADFVSLQNLSRRDFHFLNRRIHYPLFFDKTLGYIKVRWHCANEPGLGGIINRLGDRLPDAKLPSFEIFIVGHPARVDTHKPMVGIIKATLAYATLYYPSYKYYFSAVADPRQTQPPARIGGACRSCLLHFEKVGGGTANDHYPVVVPLQRIR